MLLSGEAPFGGVDDLQVMQAIAKGEPLKFRSSVWKKVSGQCKNLIVRMLNRDIEQRPSAAGVMEDVWFTERLLNRKMDKNEERNIKYHLRNMQSYKVSPH